MAHYVLNIKRIWLREESHTYLHLCFSTFSFSFSVCISFSIDRQTFSYFLSLSLFASLSLYHFLHFYLVFSAAKIHRKIKVLVLFFFSYAFCFPFKFSRLVPSSLNLLSPSNRAERPCFLADFWNNSPEYRSYFGLTLVLLLLFFLAFLSACRLTAGKPGRYTRKSKKKTQKLASPSVFEDWKMHGSYYMIFNLLWYAWLIGSRLHIDY